MTVPTPVAVGDVIAAAWGDKRPASCAGSVVITPSAVNTPTSQVISFPSGRFSSQPYVAATVASAVPQNCHIGVTSPSTTGATVTLVRSDATTATTIYWVATDGE